MQRLQEVINVLNLVFILLQEVLNHFYIIHLHLPLTSIIDLILTNILRVHITKSSLYFVNLCIHYPLLLLLLITLLRLLLLCVKHPFKKLFSYFQITLILIVAIIEVVHINFDIFSPSIQYLDNSTLVHHPHNSSIFKHNLN